MTSNKQLKWYTSVDRFSFMSDDSATFLKNFLVVSLASLLRINKTLKKC